MMMVPGGRGWPANTGGPVIMATADPVNLASLLNDAKCFALVRQHRKHAVSAAGGLLCRLGGRSAAGGTLIGDDLAQVFDVVSGEGGHSVLADPVDPQAAVFGEHVDGEVFQPVFALAEQVGDVPDREAGADRRHDQAA